MLCFCACEEPTRKYQMTTDAAAPDAAPRRTFSTTLGEADIVVVRALAAASSFHLHARWRGRRSVLTTAPGATADTMDARPRHVGFPTDPFWYDVLGSARAIVFEWRGATSAAILSPCATVRCRLCRRVTPRVATRR